ncbi:MAG TPA: hypothetical protein VMR52_11070 [Dehalococcoidia bacterium]|nr:hypothetical protein [Dehalococcoidia bacterium]
MGGLFHDLVSEVQATMPACDSRRCSYLDYPVFGGFKCYVVTATDPAGLESQPSEPDCGTHVGYAARFWFGQMQAIDEYVQGPGIDGAAYTISNPLLCRDATLVMSEENTGKLCVSKGKSVLEEEAALIHLRLWPSETAWLLTLEQSDTGRWAVSRIARCDPSSECPFVGTVETPMGDPANGETAPMRVLATDYGRYLLELDEAGGQDLGPGIRVAVTGTLRDPTAGETLTVMQVALLFEITTSSCGCEMTGGGDY